MAELRNKDELMELLDRFSDTSYNCGSVTINRDDMIEIHFFITCILRERDELREVVDGFTDFVPACTYCDGKTSEGEITEKCLYEIDPHTSTVYCGKKAVDLHMTMERELQEAREDIARLMVANEWLENALDNSRKGR